MDAYTILKIINVLTNACFNSALCLPMEENLCKIKDISCYNNRKI